MKLYLSSRTTHNCDEAKQYLYEWQKKHGTDIAIVTDARDFFEPKLRESGINNNTILLKKLGFNPTKIALKDYYGTYHKLKKFLNNFSSIHVIGGNPFLLKDVFDRSNFVKFLIEQEKNDDFLYSGSSASSYIMSPIMFEHSSDKIMQRLDSNTHSAPLKGLGYLDYAYIPHYPFLPPFECLSEIARTFEKQNLPHKTFKDGEVLVKDTITKNEVIYGK